MEYGGTAIAWVLRREEVTSAIVGSRSPTDRTDCHCWKPRIGCFHYERGEPFIEAWKKDLTAIEGVERARV